MPLETSVVLLILKRRNEKKGDRTESQSLGGETVR